MALWPVSSISVGLLGEVYLFAVAVCCFAGHDTKQKKFKPG